MSLGSTLQKDPFWGAALGDSAAHLVENPHA